ncbi:MAG: hypothetical protein AAGF79_03780 [Pseudomonadota bacterium]
MLKNIRKTILTGAVAFLPLFAAVAIAVQSLRALGSVIRPLVESPELDTRLGALIVIGLSVLTLLFLMFVLGILARHGPVSRWLVRLGESLERRVPGYTLLKGIVTGAIDDVETSDGFTPVSVRTADGLRPGFLIEALQDDLVCVYLPDVPNPRTGQALIVKAPDCTPLDMASHQMIEMLSTFGRGFGSRMKK